MLSRDEDRGGAHRTSVLVLDRHLRLPIRPQVGKSPILAQRCQALGQAVGEDDRKGHQLVGPDAGVAVHDPLIPGTDRVVGIMSDAVPRLLGCLDGGGDIGGLFLNRREDRAVVVVKPVGGSIVANLLHHAACDPIDIGVDFGRDLAPDEDEPGGKKGLASDVSLPILR